jgi:hypothetical protein
MQIYLLRLYFKKTGNKDGTLIVNAKGYLDGGSFPLRPIQFGSDSNPGWVRFNMLHAGNRKFIIQCVENGGYLDGGPFHIRDKKGGIESNPNYIRWWLTKFNGGYLLQCVENGHYLNADGTNHMWRNSPQSHPNIADITWKIENKGGFLFI